MLAKRIVVGRHFTKGKIYDVTDHDKLYYQVSNDYGHRTFELKRCFEVIVPIKNQLK